MKERYDNYKFLNKLQDQLYYLLHSKEEEIKKILDIPFSSNYYKSFTVFYTSECDGGICYDVEFIDEKFGNYNYILLISKDYDKNIFYKKLSNLVLLVKRESRTKNKKLYKYFVKKELNDKYSEFIKSNIMYLDYKLEVQEEIHEKCDKLESIIVNKICEITNMLDNTFEWEDKK